MRATDPLSAEWVTVVLLVVVFLMALINMSSPRKWRLLGQSMFRMRLGRQALREEMDLQDRAFLGLLLVATGVLALFGWQALTVRGIAPVFPSLVGLVAGIILAHYLVLRTVGALTRASAGLEEYLYTGFLIFILTGMVMLPLVVLIAYRTAWRPGLILAGVVMLVLLLLYRWLRGAWIGMGEGVPLRYIILYFCAAELLPVLLVIDHWRSTSSPLFHS
ncbi:MAG: DUF4271 domain-containing protein [Flavobacteriales bacterium]|nr:DUF4271 domain-containing protein [Flavobacteriales bacterium]HRH68057.1 DUF4271 domain-containing protein [Flavobacteriales bacterium]